MTRIYTRAGDNGETTLFGGKRVSKIDPRIHTGGGIDELNALLGVVSSFTKSKKIKNWIYEIQNDLFIIQAYLAHAPKKLDTARTERLEKIIDGIEKKLSSLRTFILPGGNQSAALLHFARTVVRRAEREVIALAKNDVVHPEILRYLNRLSDLLFVMARLENKNVKEEKPKY